MRGEYLSPIKQEIYDDWMKYMLKSCFPHAQTCEQCNMLVTVQSQYDLDVIRSYGYILPSSTDQHNSYIPQYYFKCPGCSKPNHFTGDSHLPAVAREMLTERMQVWVKKGRPDNRVRYDDIALRIIMGLFLIAMCIMVVLGV